MSLSMRMALSLSLVLTMFLPPLVLSATAVAGELPPIPTFIDCAMNFTAFDSLYGWINEFNHPQPIIQYQPLAATCPPGCAQLLTGSADGPLYQPRLFGSYPYHSSSSICLAALHSGLISASEGGGVFVSRFYRQDWSGTDNQTIFPFTSALGSVSNGV